MVQLREHMTCCPAQFMHMQQLLNLSSLLPLKLTHIVTRTHPSLLPASVRPGPRLLLACLLACPGAPVVFKLVFESVI